MKRTKRTPKTDEDIVLHIIKTSNNISLRTSINGHLVGMLHTIILLHILEQYQIHKSNGTLKKGMVIISVSTIRSTLGINEKAIRRNINDLAAISLLRARTRGEDLYYIRFNFESLKTYINKLIS